MHLDRALEGQNRILGEKYLEQMIYLETSLPEKVMEDEDVIEKSVEYLKHDLYDFEIKNYDKLKEFEKKENSDLYKDIKDFDSAEKYKDVKYGDSYIRFKN